MAIPYRRIIEKPRLDLFQRAALQAVREAGDGAGAGSTATWGSITGNIENQTDLYQRLKDEEILHRLVSG